MIDFDKILDEIYFTTARSGGSGGQHVNKVETKVILHFPIKSSQYLTEEQKSTLLEKLDAKINKDGILMISYERSRSQLKNKKAAMALFHRTLYKALEKPKKRLKTKKPKSVIERIKRNKAFRSALKKSRKKPKLGD